MKELLNSIAILLQKILFCKFINKKTIFRYNKRCVNKAKSISAQLSVNVVAAAVIDTDADVDTDDATDSTVADFAFAATFATFTNFAKFPSFATLVTFDTFATFASFADGDHDVLSHLH